MQFNPVNRAAQGKFSFQNIFLSGFLLFFFTDFGSSFFTGKAGALEVNIPYVFGGFSQNRDTVTVYFNETTVYREDLFFAPFLTNDDLANIKH